MRLTAPSKAHVFDPRAYGAAGDGVSDDTLAVQAAYDAAVAAGGGTVSLAGTHLCNTKRVVHDPVSGADFAAILVLHGRNVVIRGPGTIKTTRTDARLFLVNGAAMYEPLKQLTSARQGDTSVTLATPADAAGLAVGDYLLLRTGQTLAQDATGEPDSEINRVVSTDGGTGIIELRWPLAKPYAQEYYIAGATGLTSISGGGAAAPFGVQRFSPALDITLSQMNIETPADALPALAGGNCVGFTIENVTAEIGGHFMSMGKFRNFQMRGNRVHLSTRSTSQMRWWATGAVGVTDMLIEGNTFTAECLGQIHIHEGCAAVILSRNNMHCIEDVVTGQAVIDVRSRAYDIEIHENLVRGSGSVGIVFVTADCVGGGSVANNSFHARVNTNVIRIAPASGWIESGNREVQAA